MTLTLILFIFFGGSMTVNRLHYGKNLACKYPKWYAETYPGAKPQCKPPKETPIYVIE